MGPRLQVAFDAGDPHAQARFWAAALAYEVEDHSGIASELLGAGRLADADVAYVDGCLAFRDVAACSDADGVRPRLFFQRVPEPKTTKNRWHLDLNVGRDRIDDEVRRLSELGAVELYRVDEPGAFHTTMADPEGNEFCVQ